MKGSVTGKVVDWENGETMDQMTDSFGAWDYTVFGILLAMSSAIGIYFAWKDRQNKDEKNYALGGQKFSAWPVALSLTATSISAVTMMGSPSEYYVYGSTMAWGLIAELVGLGQEKLLNFISENSDFLTKNKGVHLPLGFMFQFIIIWVLHRSMNILTCDLEA